MTVDGGAGSGDVPGNVAARTISWKRCVCVLSFVCIGFLLQGASYSHLPSFFDLYSVEEKGLSPTQYGIIIGTYCLIMVIGSPLTAKLVGLHFFQDKTLMLIAWSVDATFGVIMSFSDKLQPGEQFFFGCLLLRILEASGCAVGFITPYVITGVEMSGYNHIIIPLLETIYGASVVAGPALSGFLYDLGGYPLPFQVLGGALISLTILAVIFFPKSQEAKQKDHKAEPVALSAMLEFTVLVNVLCTISTFVLISSNESTLARLVITKFGTSATEAGLLFLYPGGFYAISSFVLGFLSKKISDPRMFVFLGQMVMLLALTIQGPLIPIEQTKLSFIFAQILLGIGAGPALVCGYVHSLRYLANGNETKEIHAALSATFIPASLVGSTIGPALAGIIRHHFSYDTVVAGNALQIGAFSLLLLYTILMKKKRVENTEGP